MLSTPTLSSTSDTSSGTSIVHCDRYTMDANRNVDESVVINANYDNINTIEHYSGLKSRRRSMPMKFNDSMDDHLPSPTSLLANHQQRTMTSSTRRETPSKQAKKQPAKKSSSSSSKKAKPKKSIKVGRPRKSKTTTTITTTTPLPPPANVSPLPPSTSTLASTTANDNSPPPEANDHSSAADPASTSTSPSPSASTSSSIISHSDALDEILSESDDLLRAAYDAQSLGRLSEAQSYLYLVHARLIGLGQYLEPTDNVDEDEEEEEDSSSSTDQQQHVDSIGDNGTVASFGRGDAATADATSSSYPRNDTISPSLPFTTTTTSHSQDHHQHPPLSSSFQKNINLSDTLAHTAKEFLHKHTNKGMQYDADVERKRKSQKKKRDKTKNLYNNNNSNNNYPFNNAATTTGGSSSSGSMNRRIQNPNVAHGEITSRLLRMSGRAYDSDNDIDDDTTNGDGANNKANHANNGASAAAAAKSKSSAMLLGSIPCAFPRTTRKEDYAHLDAERLVCTGMED